MSNTSWGITKMATSDKDPRLLEIWNQTSIPVLYRSGKGSPLLVRLPFSPQNRAWLKGDRSRDPIWHKSEKYWRVPKAWFEALIKEALIKYKKVYVIQPFNPMEKCAPACWHAVGAECECSCMGSNHGSGNPAGKWHVVSDTLAVSWGPKQYSCRLLTPVENRTPL